ncbi:MAG: hypothetical protein HKN44_11405 [Ilumatobacter sp.]|nr:hypothetical protein [Ilumatobacter sp.]
MMLAGNVDVVVVVVVVVDVVVVVVLVVVGATVVGGAVVGATVVSAGVADSPPVALVNAVEQPTTAARPNTTAHPMSAVRRSNGTTTRDSTGEHQRANAQFGRIRRVSPRFISRFGRTR